MKEKKKTPDKQIAWQKKYDAQKMATIGLKVPLSERESIEDSAAKHGLKLSTFCRQCIKYCIAHNIDFSDDE